MHSMPQTRRYPDMMKQRRGGYDIRYNCTSWDCNKTLWGLRETLYKILLQRTLRNRGLYAHLCRRKKHISQLTKITHESTPKLFFSCFLTQPCSVTKKARGARKVSRSLLTWAPAEEGFSAFLKRLPFLSVSIVSSPLRVTTSPVRVKASIKHREPRDTMEQLLQRGSTQTRGPWQYKRWRSGNR